MPDSPAPITTTGDAALTLRGISFSSQCTARGSPPSNLRSSRNIPSTDPLTGWPARNSINSTWSSGDSARGAHPPSRYAATTGRAAPRSSAQAWSESPHWKSPGIPIVGLYGPRTQVGSPVIWTNEHKSAGMLTSASARATASSSSVKGWPAWGLRVSGVTDASMPPQSNPWASS